MSLTRAQITALVAAQFPDNTSGAITPAILRTTLLAISNSLMLWVPADATTVYVAANGSDSTGDGSIGNPLATVQAAYNLIATNADAAADHQYVVQVGPGFFSGSTLGILPWTWLIGNTKNHTVLNILPSGMGVVGGGPTILDFDVGYDAVFETAGFVYCGVANVALGDGKRFDFSLSTIGGSAGSLTQIKDCYASNIPNDAEGKFSWAGRGRADILCIDGIRSPSQAQLVDGTMFIENGVFKAGVFMGHGSAAFTITTKNCYIQGVATLQGDPSDPDGASFTTVGTSFVNGYSQSGHATLITDVGSYPADGMATKSADFAVTFINDAFGLGYTPSTPGDWNGTPPATVQEALDRLAAASTTPP